MENATKFLDVKESIANLSIEDKLLLMKTKTAHMYEPAETILENGETIQGIVIAFLKSNGGEVRLLYKKKSIMVEEQFPINRTSRISFNDYVFIDRNKKSKLLQVFMKDTQFYLLVGTTSKKINPEKRDPETVFIMNNLSYALKDESEIIYAPITEFDTDNDSDYIPLEGKDDGNSMKDFMFSRGYSVRRNRFIT